MVPSKGSGSQKGQAALTSRWGTMDEYDDFMVKRARLLNGLVVAYLEVPGGKDPILWIHGMGSYRETFRPVLVHPPTPNRHLAMDLPGFGDSGHYSRRHTLVDYAEAVNGFLQVLNIPRAILVGHSFGGMVAGETAVRFPDRVHGLVLVSSAGWADPINALTPTPYVFVNRLGIWITGMEWFGRRMVQSLGVDAASVSRDDRRRLQVGWRKSYEMARMGPFYHSPDFASRVFASGIPVAAIHGDRDTLFPLAEVRKVMDGGRAPLFVIEGSGHVPFLSHPEKFGSVFREAYNRVAGSPRSDSQ